MEHPPLAQIATRRRPPRRRTDGGRFLALTVAVLALLAVMVTLIVEGRRTRAVRQEIIATLEPARNELYELQRLLALQEAEQRGGAPPPEIRGDLPPRASIQARLDSVDRRLRRHSHAAGPDVIEAYATLRARVQQWQVSSADLGRAPRSSDLQAAVRRDYASVLRSADRLHAALNREIAARHVRARELERLEVWLVGGMVLLALVAVLGVARVARQQARLVHRMREIAAVSEARREDVERISRDKARFIRGVTHDLKNPLGAIDAYAQLLEAGIKGSLTDDQQHYVARIRSSAQQLLGTIQDLLELSRAEAEGLRLERRPVDLPALVREVVEDYRAALQARALEVRVETDDDVPRITTAPRRVVEILGNLLSNALKYTPAGGRVRVRVRMEDLSSSEPALVVDVQDTGPGIPVEAQERIFQEFERVGEHQAEGAGLGLSISRRMARLLGGDLTVQSRPREGATFSLSLPLRGSLTTTPAPAHPG